MEKKILFFLSLVSFIMPYGLIAQESTLVRNVEEFDKAVQLAQAGTTIVLANGIWKDAELLLEGKGTAEKPIKLTVEDKGKVTLEGQSNLRLAGSYLHVEGLVFKNGFTPTSEVISFRKNNNTLAYHSRVTECVIDHYSNPERHEQDSWLVLYGKNNRVDHNHMEGKGNIGVTLTVRLNSKNSMENNHIIEHNYFGPRPTLGSNGGETLRIGTSHYSMENSKTIVRNNYFDRCSGELEIISNKSCQNTFENNVFYESEGTLTLRHGNETTVKGNVFLGNRKPNTGGIRVINGQQTVSDNYGYGLTGFRFRGALVVMNGVPNSPLNRYFQVADAVIEKNVFVDSDQIQLCAGSDAERSATPIHSVFKNNTFYRKGPEKIFTIYDDISGIKFDQNTSNYPVLDAVKKGFKIKKMNLIEDEQGLMMPVINGKMIRPDLAPTLPTKRNVGTDWYSKEDKRVAFGSGKVIPVKAGINTLYDAINIARAGDQLLLTEDGTYEMSKIPLISHSLSIKAAENIRPVVLWEKKAAFEIVNGGALSLEGIVFDGENAPDYSGNAVIRTSRYSMNQNYSLKIVNCDFKNLDVNHSFDVIKVFKNTFADAIYIADSQFENISGNVMALDKETDDIGIYNAQNVSLLHCNFKNIGGAVISIYRGGKDESTFGPLLNIDQCSFQNIGFGSRNKLQSAIKLYGAQQIMIKNSIFDHSQNIKIHLVVGEPIVEIDHLNLSPHTKIEMSGDQPYLLGTLYQKTKPEEIRLLKGDKNQPLGYQN